MFDMYKCISSNLLPCTFRWETGGFVYRGSYFSDLLAGAYVFGDNVNK